MPRALQRHSALRPNLPTARLPHHIREAWKPLPDMHMHPHVHAGPSVMAAKPSTPVPCKHERNSRQRFNRCIGFSCCSALVPGVQKKRHLNARLLQPASHTDRSRRQGIYVYYAGLFTGSAGLLIWLQQSKIHVPARGLGYSVQLNHAQFMQPSGKLWCMVTLIQSNRTLLRLVQEPK